MQELLLPHFASEPVDPFDGYRVIDAAQRTREGDNRWVILFKKVDENGKNIYAVGERFASLDAPSKVRPWKLTAVREFRHARDRAIRYYSKRVNDLGA